MASPPPTPGAAGPTPEQMQQMQAAIAAEAQKRGITVEEFQAQQKAALEAEAQQHGMSLEQYINKLRKEAFENHQKQMQAQAQQQQQGQQVPIQNTGTPDPKAVALANWLRSQDLKVRTCILNGQRKDMFRVKRALRAIQSPAYAKASAKTKSNLPPVTDEFPAAEIFKLLPLSLLALRVSKSDPHEGHNHAPPPKNKKRVKGLWTVKIEQQQDISEELHYVFLYEGSQWKQKLYAVGALVAVFAIIMFPLWPLKMRIGVWYLSMGMLGLLGLFFAMAIFRLILFIATVFTVPPGLWLYPNLFEDVGFFDSFRPLWGWQEDKKQAKKAKREQKKVKAEAKAAKAAAAGDAVDAEEAEEDDEDEDDVDESEPATPATLAFQGSKTTGADTGVSSATRRVPLAASVEEIEDGDSD